MQDTTASPVNLYDVLSFQSPYCSLMAHIIDIILYELTRQLRVAYHFVYLVLPDRVLQEIDFITLHGAILLGWKLLVHKALIVSVTIAFLVVVDAEIRVLDGFDATWSCNCRFDRLFY